VSPARDDEHPMTLRVPKPLWEETREAAHKADLSIAQYVRRALREKLQREQRRA
jgi:predicted HicB family RNase H-like nuclease